MPYTKQEVARIEERYSDKVRKLKAKIEELEAEVKRQSDFRATRLLERDEATEGRESLRAQLEEAEERILIVTAKLHVYEAVAGGGDRLEGARLLKDGRG